MMMQNERSGSVSKKPVVLVIDAEPAQQDILASILKEGNFLARTAPTSEAALETIETEEVDVVLLDVRVPQGRVAELLTQMKDKKWDLPVILISAFEDLRETIDLMSQGAYTYIRKPFQPEEILLACRRAKRERKILEEYRLLNRELAVEKKTVEDVERAAELERLASLGRLAGGVAHELNNALAGMIGMAELVRMGKSQGDEMDILIDEGHRAAGIVQDLLMYARPRPKHLVLIDVREIVYSVLRIGSNSLEIRNISVQVDVAEEVPPTYVDDSQMKQILLNLLINARDAMPEGGIIRIGVRMVSGFVQIDVSDTGTGIPPQSLSKIFEPFFTTKEPGKGTGLGLSVAKSIIEAHGGTISAQNQKDGGARFTIRLPISAERLSSRAGDSILGMDAGGIKGISILLVEDEPSIREACKRMLTKMGNRVVESETVDSALNLLGQTPYDLVLSDHALPGRTGVEFHQILKKLNRPEASRFILMSGLAPEEIDTHIPILSKPFKIDALTKAFQKLKRSQEVCVPPEFAPRSPRILVVDDEEGIRLSLCEMIRLQYPGISVYTADNGVQALLKIGKSKPDLVILDVRMPEMDGIAVIRHLKVDLRFQGIKVIAISGYKQKSGRVGALDVGADAFYEKTEDLKDLVRALPEYLPDLGRYRSTESPVGAPS